MTRKRFQKLLTAVGYSRNKIDEIIYVNLQCIRQSNLEVQSYFQLFITTIDSPNRVINEKRPDDPGVHLLRRHNGERYWRVQAPSFYTDEMKRNFMRDYMCGRYLR